ncbi:uncharacterized protein LOC125940308 [Dermacentor silvarum]|uniref:uncharacterized protein LOC125940308 n=1 Tax=Dermacentor silvarum TaxID=543639 RepID=UPI002100FAFE|nr:uncharacterized protein LOC125940308 [Dermacentor silvarum]
MDAGSSADEGGEPSDLEEDPRTPFAGTPLTENANHHSSSPSTNLSKAMPIPSSGPSRSLGHGVYAATHSGRDYFRSGRPERSTSLDHPSMPGDIYELKKRLRQSARPVTTPGREPVQGRSQAQVAGTDV